MPIVAMLDMLGFRNYIKNVSLDVAIDEIGSQLDFIIDNSTRSDRLSHEEVLRALRTGEYRSALARQREPGPGHVAPDWMACKHLRFSDTILLYNLEDTRRAFLGVLVSTFDLMSICMAVGIPLRGAITRGELHVSSDRSLYIGEAIVRAHDLEVVQQWAGVIVDEGRLDDGQLGIATRHFLSRSGIIVEADVPLKDGRLVKRLVLGWPEAFPREFNAEGLMDLMGFDEHLSWEAREKISNTIRFYRAYHKTAPVQGEHPLIVGWFTSLLVRATRRLETLDWEVLRPEIMRLAEEDLSRVGRPSVDRITQAIMATVADDADTEAD
ncbi:MAG: hypothetical protein QOE90_2977 [Thermoplasmata archaeon]|jgi:hypothetical protein|nr:hypothetical protein [Thermoplasmata archaeon]